MRSTLEEPKWHRLFGRLVREPLIHFLLIGLAVFFVFGQRSRPSATDPETIEITDARIARLEGQFEAAWRRPPTAKERDTLVEEFVREEVYYREALALGLDRDDAVIRRRLRQKMEFLGDAGAGAVTPDDAELQTFLDEHPEQFTTPTLITFQQISLGEEDPGPALQALAAGADSGDVGRGSLLPATMEAAVETSVDGTFGDDFFAQVARLPLGKWQGPVQSSYGAHLVRLVELEPARSPMLAQVRDRVEMAWRQQAAGDLRETQYQALQVRYRVMLPDAGAAR